MSLSRRLLLPSCAAVLVSLAACDKGPTSLFHSMSSPAPSSAADKPAAKATAMPSPTSTAPMPSPDAKLAQALDHLGAKHGPRGEVLTLPSEDFGPGPTKLRSDGATELQHVAAVLRDYPNADLLIEGYTDNRGKERSNERLSLGRADTVKQALMKDGLEVTRMSARGLGPADPIGDNHTAAGREQNRRVELVFSDSTGKFVAAEGHAKS